MIVNWNYFPGIYDAIYSHARKSLDQSSYNAQPKNSTHNHARVPTARSMPKFTEAFVVERVVVQNRKELSLSGTLSNA
jgi:hypothetical protein